MEGINPGIRRVVAWLQGHGFETTDSGDGRTHDYECDREIPYVICAIDGNEVVSEANRLRDLLEGLGIELGPVSDEDVCIQATYDPYDGTAFLDLMGLDDEMLCDMMEDY